MVRRGSWSLVVWRSVDFIPLKFYGVPSCLALGVGALSAGARARFSAAPPRGPPGSGGTFSGGLPVCRHRTAFQWRGPSVAEGVHASLHPPLRPVGLAAYRVPYSRPDPPMGGRGRGAGSVPVRGTSSPRCSCAGRDYPRTGTHRCNGGRQQQPPPLPTTIWLQYQVSCGRKLVCRPWILIASTEPLYFESHFENYGAMPTLSGACVQCRCV